MPDRRAGDKDAIAAQRLAEVIWKLDQHKDGKELSKDDIDELKSITRSAQDQLLNAEPDERIRKLEMWVLVLVNSCDSREIPQLHGPSIYRTTIIDQTSYHLAINKLHEVHRDGIARRSALETA